MAKELERKGDRARGLEPWRPFGDPEGWPSGFGSGFPWWSSLLPDWPWRDRQERSGGFFPAMDVSENDERYVITLELPGGKKDDVQVELHEGVLTVRGQKKSEREESQEQRRYIERSYGAFSRSFRLPDDADPSRLDASFKDGVLTITVPRSERARPRTISVKAG